ncbi:MAG: HEAT repeat domain-containing protein [Woeseiaceae bacterium]
MNLTIRTPLIAIITSALLLTSSFASAETLSDKEQLKIAAIEALMATSSERALPVLTRVMSSDNSDTVKSRALFVLSQIDHPDAHAMLLDTAKTGSSQLKEEAIRTIGISGDPALLKELASLYGNGDQETQRQVLHAYLIAGDAESIYDAALDTDDEEIFDLAVSRLGAMGASDQLKRLRDKTGNRRSLIHAYAISGDVESLLAIARDTSNPEQQEQAIHGLGIAGGGDGSEAALLEIYRAADTTRIRDAVMHGMLVGDFDSALLTLFKESEDQGEKSKLLRQLVIMDSDIAMEAIDSALSD